MIISIVGLSLALLWLLGWMILAYANNNSEEELGYGIFGAIAIGATTALVHMIVTSPK